MKTSFGLLFSALFVSAVLSAQLAPNTWPIQLLPGQSYIYAYTGRLVSGIAQLDTSAAVLEIKSDIVLQPEADGSKIAMQMTNIRVGKHNGIVPDHLVGRIVIDHQEAKEYVEELAKPIRFIWVNGQVKSLEASATEPEWSINVKKSILSLLNVNLNPQKIIQTSQRTKQNSIHSVRRTPTDPLVVYPIYEDGIGGICETLYEVKQSPYGWQSEEEALALQQFGQSEKDLVLNVTKTRVYDNCLTRPTIENTNVDIRGAPVACKDGKPFPAVSGYYPMGAESEFQRDAQEQGPCANNQKIEDSPVEQFNYVKYNISKKAQEQSAQIESIFGEGKTLLTSNGKQIMVIVQQNLTIEQVLPSQEVGHIKQVNNGIVHEELSFRLPKPVDASPLDIPYFHLFGKVNPRELEQLIPEMLNSLAEDIIANDIASNKNTMQKTVELNNAISVLDGETLERIFVKVAAKGRSTRATSQEQIVRKLFIDLLGSAGSTETALLAVRLYEKDLITTLEARELIEAIPQNLFIVDLKVVEAYLNLFLSDKVQQQRHLASSVGIAFGKMIHEAQAKRTQTPGDIQTEEDSHQQRRAQQYVQNNQNIVMQQQQQQQQQQFQRIRRSAPWEKQFPQELIQQEQIQKVLTVLREALRQAKTFPQKVTLIETLAHMAVPEVLEILAPYVNDQAPVEELPGYLVEDEQQIAEERNFVRQVTVYALAHVARQYPQQVLALVLPVYENKAEPYELRIAAITIAINCQPGKQILERVASELHTENNRQVKSFVASALETAANFTQPALKQLAEDARLAVQLAPKDKLGLHYSKMVGHDYYDEQKQFGVNYVAEWVSSNVSQVPRSAYFALSQTKGPFKNVMVELGYNAKGVDSLIKRLVEPNGIVTDAFESMNTQTKDRRILRKRSAVDSSATQALSALKEKLNLVIRSDDEPKATVFMKLFERTSYLALDRHYIHSIIDSAEDTIKDVTAQLMAGKSFHYVKLIMPNQLYKVVPSELGLPVVITQRHPTIFSLKINKAKLQLDMPTGQAILPTGANLTVQMQPSLFHATYDFVFALSPATQEAVGTHVEKTTRASLPVELSVGFARNQLSWSVVPTVPQEVVHHHTEAKTFISKAAIASSPDRDWLEESVQIKTKRQPFQFEKQYLKNELGLGFRVQVQTENPLTQGKPLFRVETAKKHGVLAAVLEMANNGEITPREMHIILEQDEEKQVSGFDFNLRYKRVQDLEPELKNDTDDEKTWEEEDQEQINLAEQTQNKRQAWVWAARAAKNAAGRRSQEAEQMPVSSAPTSQQVWEKIFGTKYARKSIKSVARDLMAQTKPVWKSHWAESESEQYSERSEQDQKLPAIVAHDVVLTAVARSSRPVYYGVNALLVKTFDERAYWLKVNAFARKESIQNFGQTKSVHNHKELCFDGVISYPAIPDEFYYEPTATQDLKAKMHARIAFGYDCQQSQQQQSQAQIVINGLLEKTDEKVIRPEDLGRSTEGDSPVQPEAWFYQQCAVDRAQGKPLSFACERAIIEDSYFKQAVFDIEYHNIAPQIKNLTRKLALATKVALYDHLELNEALDEQQDQLTRDNKPNKIRITAQFSTRFADIPLANLYIQSPKENAFFEKIHVPAFRPISALLPLSKVYKNLWKQYEAVDKCVVMEQAVRTFDNVTFRLDQLQQSPCQFLIAKDCSASEKFAIFARQLDQDSKTKAVTVLVAGSEIRLLPPTKSANQAQVVIDGRTVQLQGEQVQKPELIAKNGGDIVVYLRKPRSSLTEPIIVVKAKQADLVVLYDGKNVKIELGKQYQGKTCGLCGDNNDEAEEELTGPDACIYQREQDFIASYALAGAHCEQAPVAKGPKRCPAQALTTGTRAHTKAISAQYGYVQLKAEQAQKQRSATIQAEANAEELARLNQNQMEQIINRSPMQAQQQFGGQQQQFNQQQQQFPASPAQQQLLQRLRTYFIHQQDKVCFSTTPVVSCVEGVSRPVQFQQQLIAFHCLPAQSISVQRLTMQAQSQVLGQFARKPVHYSQYVQVPVACAAL